MDLDVPGSGEEEAIASLRRSFVSGVKWSTASQVGRQVVQLVTTIILARLLVPSDFGLVSMAMVVVGFVLVFADLGTAAAVIQREELSEGLMSSVFWANMAFGLSASVALFAASPLVAAFYEEQRVAPILQVLSVSFLVTGLGISHRALLERGLAFDKLARLEIAAVLAGSVAGIGAGLLGLGAWSIVCQTLVVTTATTLLLWVASSWRPALKFDWGELKSVAGYSLNLTGFNSFNYLVRNVDYLLIGWYLGAQNLGYYTLAYRLLLYPTQNVASVITRVMFPAFSRMQDDERFRRAYLRVVGIIAMITFPMMLGLWALAEPFVLAVFGPQWRPVVILLMILVPVGMFQSVATTVGVIYTAKGRTDWMLRWSILAGVVVMAAFVVGLRWGTIGVAAAYAATSLILFYPSFAIPFRLISLPVRDLFVVLWRPFASGLLMLVAVLGLIVALPAGTRIGVLATAVPVGIVVYLMVSCLINREQVREVVSLLGSRDRG
jgi:O-antigen/teichoic acid export membrane protein